MSVQSVVTAQVALAPETVWGTAPTSGYVEQPRVNWSVTLQKEAYNSNRVQANRRIRFSRHGTRFVEGNYEDELSIGGQDLVLESALGGTFQAGATSTLTVEISAAADTLTRATGSWIADGFLPGLVVEIANAADPANNGRARVLAATATVLTLDKALVDASADEIAISVVGKVLRDQAIKRSFAAQIAMADLDTPLYFIQSGLLVSQATLNLAPNGISTINATIMGRDEERRTTPLDASVEASPSGELLTTPEGELYLDGVLFARLTELSVEINNNVSRRAVIGSNAIENLNQGRLAVTGSLSALLDGPALLERFDDETEFSLVLRLNAPNGTDFQSIILPRVRLNGATKNLQGEEEVIVSGAIVVLESVANDATLLIQSTAAI